jgi:3-phenylpropionate/trans-cinnamate dioxygenase ferredoxin reductase subunit
MEGPPRRVGAAATLRIVLYVLIVLIPLLLVAIVERDAEPVSALELGKGFALVGYAILAMQFVVSARLKWVEEPFGLDRLFRFHKAMAIVATALLLSHPVLLVLGGFGMDLLVSFQAPWYILVAKATLLILVLMVLVATFRAAIPLDFEKWRLGHNSAAAIVLVLGALHAWFAGDDLRLAPVQAGGIAIVGLAVVAYVHHRFWAPVRARREAYEVTEVTPETHNVWTTGSGLP